MKKTHYSKAWCNYIKSTDYSNSVKELISKGLIQPYIDNILKGAFDAGYNSKQLVTFKIIKNNLV